MTLFGDYSGAFRTENFSAPELLTRHLRIVDFFELRKQQKSPQKCILWASECFGFSTRDPAGIRTQDPYIKSVMLYQLSYEILCF